MPRFSDRLLQEIRTKYVPRDEDGEEIPGVLWVGPFIDGLAEYVPEIFPALFPRFPDSARNPASHRHRLKSLIRDAGKNRTVEAVHIDDLQLGMRRASWPPARSGEPLTLYFIDRPGTGVINQEFGELRNSPQEVVDPSTGEVTLQDHKGNKIEPEILEDKRWGLHYLLVGDEFDFTWSYRQQPQRVQFKLRDKSEGTSLVTPERTNEAIYV